MFSFLEAFGFKINWVNWIMRLTSSSSFSILVNGVPSQPFSPTRGICQGDPLSPFLLVLMMEGLGHYLKSLVLDESIKGVTLHNVQLAPSHREFLDDTLLLNTLTSHEDTKLNSILNDFSDASRMSLNLHKCNLYFFNMPVIIQNHISRLLGIPNISLPSNYLGIPLIGAPTCFISWEILLLSISNRLNNWTFRPLNIAARMMLLKSILQTFPTYLFTALAAPNSII
jgi:hypothetical protein